MTSNSYGGPILCPLCQQTGQTWCTHKGQPPEKLAALEDARAGRLNPGAGRAPVQQSSSGASSEWTPAKAEFLLKFGLYATAAALAWFFYSHSGSGVEPQESGVEKPETDPNPEDYSSWEPQP